MGYYDLERMFSEAMGTAAVWLYISCFGILAAYVLNAIAVMMMASKLGIANSWLSFIPFGDMYMRGRVADVGSTKSTNTSRLMVVSIVQGCCLAVCAFCIFLTAQFGNASAAVIFTLAFVGFCAASVVQFIFLRVADAFICSNFGSGMFPLVLIMSLVSLSTVAGVVRLVIGLRRPVVSARRNAPSEYDRNAFSSSSAFTSSTTSTFSSDNHSDFSQPFGGSSWDNDRFR